MEKKDREKYGNFVHEQRKKEEEILEICQEVLETQKMNWDSALFIWSR